MSEESMSPADMMAMMNGNGNMNNQWNNPFMYLIWLAMFGNGFGGWGNNSAANATQNAVTRAEMTDGFNNQNLQTNIGQIQNGISGLTSVVHDTGNTVENTVQGSTADLQNSLTNGFNGVNQAINQNTFNNQMGFCGVNNSINNLKYEMAQNCCDLKTAMHSEGEATRALMTQNTIQDLRDKLADKAADLQSAQLTLANANQTQNILSSMGRYVPYSGCGNTCGCSSF